MSARFPVVLAIALIGSWAVAGPAQALEPGVFIDPGSPAGKEYSVPLSVLRGAASGRPGGGGGAPPLFGVGVSAPRVSPRARPARNHGGRSRRTTGAQSSRPSSQAPGAQTAAAASSSGAAPAAGIAPSDLTTHGSATPAVALIGALVVLGGLGAGAVMLAARRRLG
jgi:hypothetical protein